MNTILQKRIEEAAQKHASCLIGEDQNQQPLIDALIQIATFALQNQWISVEEALPEESGDYLVVVKQSSDSEAYFYKISTYSASDNIWYYVGKLVITHWALIPSLKGGKK